MASKFSTEELLAKRKRCPNLHSHLKQFCLSENNRNELELPEKFRNGVVDLPNHGKFKGETIPSQNERICDRCRWKFRISQSGECIRGPCNYHEGRFREDVWTCCGGEYRSKRCKTANKHVHKGNLLIEVDGYVEFSGNSKGGRPKILALDTELIYTVSGMEVAKVTFIDVMGKIVYERYVNPNSRIMDYNSRFSGIDRLSFAQENPISITTVQEDLKDIIFADTILVGHGLKLDLLGLKIFHPNVVDTSFYYKSHKGLPQALKKLSKEMLQREIQTGFGHDPTEDAMASMDLALLLIQNCNGED